jgi:transcriptional regulator with XRE-family HTH domain
MPNLSVEPARVLSGHALRDAHLRERSLARAETGPPLARAVVRIRAGLLGLTRLEFVRRSGIGRGTLRDLELGVHTPTRRTLQRFLAFCQRAGVSASELEQLRVLYAGPADSLEHFLGRLELRAGSAAELAHQVGISPAALWEYRRGNFPLPLPLLRRLCETVGEDPAEAEPFWHMAQRRRLLARGYPEALAEFWTLCARGDYAERHLHALGLGTAAARQLRYLELPPWPHVANAARSVCRDDGEFRALRSLWIDGERAQRARDSFGPRIKQLRKQEGVSRRELADLFGVGGKKPARILKHIEEDGFYSARAYPAGLAALLGRTQSEREQLLAAWQARRGRFHRRHRPEMRTDLRLARELYGFGLRDVEPILGYSSREYQLIERGVSPLRDTARARILDAIHGAGQRKIEQLLQRRAARDAARAAWQMPPSLPALFELLARREGGYIPLARLLGRARLRGVQPVRLRAFARGEEVPPRTLVEQVGAACGVVDLSQARIDWTDRYRAQLRARRISPLGAELRLLIAEICPTLRDFSPRMGLDASTLVRDLARIDHDVPVRWSRVERILRAAGVAVDDARWREARALWATTGERLRAARDAGRRREGAL